MRSSDLTFQLSETAAIRVLFAKGAIAALLAYTLCLKFPRVANTV
jgi:hypothetical protein